MKLQRKDCCHYKYKEGTNDEDRFDKWFGQIREVISSQDTIQ
jgi:GTP pyrophosphokinase